MPSEIQSTLLAIEGKEDQAGSSIRFQLMTREIRESHRAEWYDNTIVGRSEPIKCYAGGSARSYNFELMFCASVEPGDGWNAEGAYDRVKFLQSLTYPQETGVFGFITAPPVLTLLIGRVVATRVVAVGVDVTWMSPWVRTDDGPDLPIVAKVDLRLEEVNPVALSQPDYYLGHNQVFR